MLMLPNVGRMEADRNGREVLEDAINSGRTSFAESTAKSTEIRFTFIHFVCPLLSPHLLH